MSAQMKTWTVDEDDTTRFREITVAKPAPSGRDLLVKVEAISINPVDYKVRPGRPGRTIGWDASGVVVATGDGVDGFEAGDEVYYAGDLTRPGTYAQYHLVDARIVGRKPHSIDHARAAALPLTALTAYEALYEQIQVTEGGTLLVLAGAGGVGSVATQLARKLSGMTVIATASRPETRAWVREMGATHVVDHREDMPAQVRALGFEYVDAILCCNATAAHFDAMAELIGPQGTICSIVEVDVPLPIGRLMRKKARFAWELMFTKSLFGTADLASQGRILDHIGRLIDAGTLKTTARGEPVVVSADALAEAHVRQASGKMIGKQVLVVPHP